MVEHLGQQLGNYRLILHQAGRDLPQRGNPLRH